MKYYKNKYMVQKQVYILVFVPYTCFCSISLYDFIIYISVYIYIYIL